MTEGYTTGNGGATYKHTSAEEFKQLLANMKPAVNLGRAYLVVPPDVMQLDMDFAPFEDEQTTPRVWRNHWGDYNFGIPVIRSHAMLVNAEWARPPVKEEPVLPRLVAEHVEPEKPKDLTFWQALIFVVGVGTILCLLGGAL